MKKLNHNNRSSSSVTMAKKNTQTGNNSATVMSDDDGSIYQREIDDLELLIRKLKKEQKRMKTLKQTDTQISRVQLELDSGAYVSREIEMGVKIKNLELKLKTAKKRFRFILEDDDF